MTAPQEEWTELFQHDGKGCPCVGRWAQWELDGGHEFVGRIDINGFKMIAPGIVEGVASIGNAWVWSPDVVPVIRYRIKKPRALIDLIQLIADLPAPAAPIKTDGVIS